MGKKGNKGKVPLGDLSTFEFQPPDAVHGPPREPVRPLRVEAFQADLGRAGVFEIGELSSATTVQELTRHIEAEHNGAVLNLRVFMDVAMDGRLLNDGAETLGAALQRFHGEGNRTMLARDADEGVLSVAYDFDSMAGCPLLLKQPELLSPSHGGSPDSESPRGKAGTPTGGTPGGANLASARRRSFNLFKSWTTSPTASPAKGAQGPDDRVTAAGPVLPSL